MISLNAVIISLLTFLVLIGLGMAIVVLPNRQKKNKYEERLGQIPDEPLYPEETLNKFKKNNKKRSIYGKLMEDYKEAEMSMPFSNFMIVMVGLSILLFIVVVFIFKQPLIGLSPLPFTLYLLPRSIVDSKKIKIIDEFEDQLINVLRRMSSVLKNGSVIQALESVKDVDNYSPKMKLFLSEVHHRFKYGDSIETAFYKASEKIPSKNLRLCCISIDINKELGSDLGHSLNEISMNMQKRKLIEKESKSLMATTLMIGKTLSVAPFLILGYLGYSTPEMYVEYLQSIPNQLIFMTGIMVMLLGVFVIEKMGRTREEEQ